MAQYMQDFIFNHGSDEENPKKRNRKRFWLRTVALLILIFFMFGGTIEYASKLAFKSMMLNLFGEEMELPEPTPIDFDMDSFWDSTDLSYDEKGENLIRSCRYESSEEMYEATGILLTESEELEV